MPTRRDVLTASIGALLIAAVSSGPATAADPLFLAGTRHDGVHVVPNDFTGWRLVYFGYTHCPDVCPLGLQAVAEALDALGPLGEKITPVFVTVDPERDTPEVMANYVDFFHPRLIGLTPSEGELRAMARVWRVRFARVEIGEGRPYLMDHTATLLLADPAGAAVGRFSHDIGGLALAAKLRPILEGRP